MAVSSKLLQRRRTVAAHGRAASFPAKASVKELCARRHSTRLRHSESVVSPRIFSFVLHRFCCLLWVSPFSSAGLDLVLVLSVGDVFTIDGAAIVSLEKQTHCQVSSGTFPQVCMVHDCMEGMLQLVV